jgi:hypothetical protein
LVGLCFPNRFRSQPFSIFKEQGVDSIKLLGVLRQAPSRRGREMEEFLKRPIIGFSFGLRLGMWR